jgi:hypothetical protein
MDRAREPGWNVAQRFRLAPAELDEVRAEIYGHLRRRGRDACTWEVGSSATRPISSSGCSRSGWVELEDSSAVSMALTGEPAEPPPSWIDVRRSANQEDERLAAEIAAVCFGGTPWRGGTTRPRLSSRTSRFSTVSRPAAPRARSPSTGLALRRRHAARGTRPRGLPHARTRAVAGRCGSRHAGCDHPGELPVQAYSRTARVPRGLHDPGVARPVRQPARDRRSFTRGGASLRGLTRTAALEGRSGGRDISGDSPQLVGRAGKGACPHAVVIQGVGACPHGVADPGVGACPRSVSAGDVSAQTKTVWRVDAT